MNSTDRHEERLNERMAVALEEALTRALPRPQLPIGFRTRLESAIASAPALDHSVQLRALDNEHDEQLSILRTDFIRLRRRTLGMLIGVAFAAGAAVAESMPWITNVLGSKAVFVGPSLGATLGVAIALAAWLRRDDMANLLL
jgi:hypothetical protein